MAYILTINSGSSSLKFSAYEVGTREALLLSGRFERIGLAGGIFDAAGSRQHIELPSHGAALRALFEWLQSYGPRGDLRAVGHRLVYGGREYEKPQLSSGDLDPGAVFFLLERGLSPAGAKTIVNAEAGLLGVSGISSDTRDLLAKEGHDPHAAEAIALFCYQAKKFLGSLAAVLGGIDTLVFTAGIGENTPSIRSRICEGFGVSRHSPGCRTERGKCGHHFRRRKRRQSACDEDQ